MTHAERSKLSRSATPCSVHHLTFGGRCLNCGYDPANECRIDVKAILRDANQRRHLLADAVRFIQAVEGRDLSYEEALHVIDRTAKERSCERNIL